jgi:purine-binding chemotaxis protein CheW
MTLLARYLRFQLDCRYDLPILTLRCCDNRPGGGRSFLSTGLFLKKANRDDPLDVRTSTGTSAVSQQYLTFTLGFERFGVPILSVLEIIEYGAPAVVPGLPSLFSGVISLRETAVPVIELATCLNRSAESVSKRTCILIVETGNRGAHRQVGFIVDSVSEVIDIAQNAIHPPPMIGAMGAEPYLIGTGRIACDPFNLESSGIIVLIDFEPLITMFAGESSEALPAA